MNEIANEDVVRLIITEDWREVLFRLTPDMDPWNIDLIELNSRFMVYIRKMTEMDLRVPAKILLAAAMIYRMKAETLQGVEMPAETDGEFDELTEAPDGEKIVIPPISVPLKRHPARKVSLEELIKALQKAMKITKRREARHLFQIELKGEDITQRIEEMYGNLLKLFEKVDQITFSQILSNFGRVDKVEKIKSFNSLLHLSNQERVHCYQKELFGEIYISKL